MSDCHPTAEQLYEMVRDRTKCDCISLATVYNTLEVLCEAGLCVRLPVTQGSARFDANLVRHHNGNGDVEFLFDPGHEPHLHVVDEQSGAIHDVPDDLSQRFLDRLPRDVVRLIEQELGFEINQISLHLVGRARAAALTTNSGSNGRLPQPIGNGLSN